MATKAKFKVGDRVARAYDSGRRTWKIVKIKQVVSYEYLIEDKEGARVWSSYPGIRRGRKGG